MSIVSIKTKFSISRNAVSKHLHILQDAGLVNRREMGRMTLYSLKAEKLNDLKQWLSFFDRYWEDKLSSLKEHVESDDE